MQDNVWLYGGTTGTSPYSDDFYKLNMQSLAWTIIEPTMPRPNANTAASITQISVNHLISFGKLHPNTSHQKPTTIPWIFDIQSHTWGQHPVAENHHEHYTGITGLNNSVIFLGGRMCIYGSWKRAQYQVENTIFSVMLEPKCLQQLVIQMIYKHRSNLPWQNLPKKLKCEIMGNE